MSAAPSRRTDTGRHVRRPSDRTLPRRVAADGAAREVLEHIRARVPLTDLGEELAQHHVRRVPASSRAGK